MNDLNLYMRNKDSIYNEQLNTNEKNNEIESFIGNYMKNKAEFDNYIKKNLSYSKVISNKKGMYKAKTSININKIGPIKKNSYTTLYKTKTSKSSNTSIFENRKNVSAENQNLDRTNIENYNNSTQYIDKHSSMKYFKVSPIIKPIFNRVYFSPKINIQTTNNNDKHCNLYINNKEILIKEIDEETPSTSRKTKSLNKMDNKQINITCKNNYININNKERINRKIKNDKKIIFMKKRIPSCPRKALSKTKKEVTNINDENQNDNINKNNNYCLLNTNTCNTNNITIKNKKIDNLQYEETCSIYIENSKNKINNNYNINYNMYYKANTHKYPDNDQFNKTNNVFNKGTIKQNKTKINLEEMNKNSYVNIRNKYKKDYIVTNNNSNVNHEDTKIAFKELNLEDFLLIIQKFDDIGNNLKLLNSFCSINLNQNMNSTKKILEINHINRIKLYDLFKFFMGSSFDGSPEKLFSSKKSKFYFHCYTIIFILSIGMLYIISQNIKLTQECFEDITQLLNIQKKIFLLFCDSIIQKLNKKYKQNLWVTQILEILNNKLIFNISNHIVQIKNLTIDSYDIINNLLIAMNNFNFNNQKNENIKYQENYLYDNFFNKNIKIFAEFEINQIEEEFNTIIFKTISLRSNYANISSFKRSITLNNYKDFFIKKNNYNNSSCNNFNKGKKNNCSVKYNNNINANDNYINKNNNNNISTIKKANGNKTTTNKNVFKKDIQIYNNKYLPSNTKNKNNTNIYLNLYTPNQNTSSSIEQYDIIMPDTEVDVPEVTVPFLKFKTDKKYTLVMDLDETMVNFKFTNIQKGIGKLYIRPCLENFLEVIKDYYEIISFTSATRDYADIALDIIEKNKRKNYFDGRLYREHTTQFGKKYIKDLSKLGRDLGRIIIVDNLSQCFKLHGENGILISSFYGEDENDKVLIELQKILIKIYYENCDVRKSLNKYKDEIFNKISKVTMNYS